MSGSLRWLDRLAHDLRGPLTPLQTAAYLLKSGQLEPERQQELFDLIERQARRLGRMIEELDDWSRADCGSLLGVLESSEASLLLDIALGGIAPGAALRPSIVDESSGACVHGDPVRLVQLLRIMIEYASARGGGNPLSLRMHLNDAVLRVDVVDGRAPDPGQLATLLEEPQPEPFDEGLGLKLLIARAIAEAHGGTLTAEADPEGGLLLRCTLPLA